MQAPRGNKDDLEIDENITYSLINDTFNKPLIIINRSDNYYSYKIKTNQKTVISMVATHDFVKPNTTKEIKITLADKPSESNQLKLQINYVIPTEQQLRTNDSKMISYGKDAVFKKIIVIKRDDQKLQNVHKKIEVKEVQINKKVQKKEVNNSALNESLDINKSTDNFTVMIEKSEEIDVRQFIQAHSSQQALKKYQQQASNISIPNDKVEINKGNSPIKTNQEQDPSLYKQMQKHSKDELSQSKQQKIKDLNELNEKISNQEVVIKQLQREISSQKPIDSIYPFPILLLIVIMSFIIGSLMSYLCF